MFTNFSWGVYENQEFTQGVPTGFQKQCSIQNYCVDILRHMVYLTMNLLANGRVEYLFQAFPSEILLGRIAEDTSRQFTATDLSLRINHVLSENTANLTGNIDVIQQLMAYLVRINHKQVQTIHLSND